MWGEGGQREDRRFAVKNREGTTATHIHPPSQLSALSSLIEPGATWLVRDHRTGSVPRYLSTI